MTTRGIVKIQAKLTLTDQIYLCYFGLSKSIMTSEDAYLESVREDNEEAEKADLKKSKRKKLKR
jgi:hypothetical protein